ANNPAGGGGGVSVVPGLAGGAGSAGLLFGQLLLWGVVIAAIVVVAVIILRRQGVTLFGRRRAVLQPAGWPLQPHLVATRAELIAAFEYLSLLLLGREARTWNHKDIAAAVGDPDRATPD